LVISNHQSYLDPIVLGLALSRSANFIAKSELFGVPPLRWLITALNAIKIEREGMTKESLRTSIDRLRNGGIVVLWPEGTRTSDGRLGPLHAGVLLLCRRAQVPAVVAGVSGSFDAWPRHQILPIPQPIWIHFDRWHYDNQASTGDNLRHLESVLQAAVNEASKRRQRFLHTKRGVSKFLERQP
jgi:1-acyl-sn-glycerol-3-phosphate acyltransferase